MSEDDTVALQKVSLYQTISWVVAGTFISLRHGIDLCIEIVHKRQIGRK